MYVKIRTSIYASPGSSSELLKATTAVLSQQRCSSVVYWW